MAKSSGQKAGGSAAKAQESNDGDIVEVKSIIEVKVSPINRVPQEGDMDVDAAIGQQARPRR